MTDKFNITYQIENIDKTILNNDPGYTVFMMSAITGNARIALGEKYVNVTSCGLLRLSNALIYLSTIPLLYRLDETESRLDEAIDMTSTLENEQIKLGLHGSPYRVTTYFSIPPMEALAEVGRFQAGLVSALFSANEAFRANNRVREYLFFASDNLLK